MLTAHFDLVLVLVFWQKIHKKKIKKKNPFTFSHILSHHFFKSKYDKILVENVFWPAVMAK